jgi:hypothetical protein
LRWKYAAGGLGFDYPGFVHTVLVDMRARLAASEDSDRIFSVMSCPGFDGDFETRFSASRKEVPVLCHVRGSIRRS